MPLDVSKAPASASPLWIIALFIALSEATAGVAAITTNGGARLIFACFAVSFPTVVFVVFVWLLIKHAPNLYAPGQYSKDITPEIYRTGIGISRAQSLFIGRAVAEAVVPLFRDHADDHARGEVVEQVARKFEVAVAESSVTVTLNRVKPGAELLQIPITEETTVDSLLDVIYFALAPAVRPFTYGQTWTLIDDHGNEYNDMGTPWARSRNLTRDTRPITQVGIVPAEHLTAVAKARTDRRRSAFNRRLASLINDLRAELDSRGIPVEDVSGQQRPRLLARVGGQAYGLYVMSGNPRESWVNLTRAATVALEGDRGFPIVPVLALDQQPAERLLKVADASAVAVSWLVQGVLQHVPWEESEP